MANTTKLYQFLKEYVLENYSDYILSEKHAAAVARGLEYYLTDKLIPETIETMVSDKDNEE